MAGHSSKKKKAKLTVIETYHEFRHNDAVKTAKRALKMFRKNKNTTAIVVCIETTVNGYDILSSFSNDRPRLGSVLITMGLTKMGFVTKE